jgi:hypothetical protein
MQRETPAYRQQKGVASSEPMGVFSVASNIKDTFTVYDQEFISVCASIVGLIEFFIEIFRGIEARMGPRAIEHDSTPDAEIGQSTSDSGEIEPWEWKFSKRGWDRQMKSLLLANPDRREECGMREARTAVGPGPSRAIREYMAGKISSSEYFRKVTKETSRQVDRELSVKSPKTAATA